ncbi:MAG: type I pantothenate kinase [Bradymonadia bacterium]
MNLPSRHGPSPYLTFDKVAWAALRANTPMTLDSSEIEALQGLNERVDVEEVEQIYLPLSRLLNFHVEATQKLYQATSQFLSGNQPKVPYIIGLAGSVSAGKSTTARLLKALLARWPGHPKVDLVTTDGFLLPNATLKTKGIMHRKGFPESYDLPALLRFLSAIKAGEPRVAAPVYSHNVYDIVPDQFTEVCQPDILIVEGLNVLQTGRATADGDPVVFVSDFFDFSIYLHADEPELKQWYVERFFRLRQTAFKDPSAYFHRFSKMSATDARAFAEHVWDTVNLVNLRANIAPTRLRADLILYKGLDHGIHQVDLRKL